MERIGVFFCPVVYDFVAGDVKFIFRVYADGTLSGLMENTGGASNFEDKSVQRTLNGRVVQRYAPADFEVEFIDTTWQSKDDVCTARLSTKGMIGQCLRGTKMNNVALTSKESCHFVERLVMPCLPPTPGIYRFKGCSVSSSANFLDVPVVEMELRSDGSVVGKMIGRIGRNSEEYWHITGTWTHDRIHFTLTGPYYEYAFTGVATLASLRGRWETKDIKPEDQDFIFGLFDFTIERCEHRAWCESLHRFFPPVFQKSVRWLLLSSLRASEEVSMPSMFWTHVLEFCDQDWFIVEETNG